MTRKAKVNNFQFNSTGRDSGDKTFTFKAREFVPGSASKGRKRGETVAYNIRCNANRGGDACKAAVAIMKKVQHDLANVPTDEGRSRFMVDEGPGGTVSAGFRKPGGKKRKIVKRSSPIPDFLK